MSTSSSCNNNFDKNNEKIVLPPPPTKIKLKRVHTIAGSSTSTSSLSSTCMLNDSNHSLVINATAPDDVCRRHQANAMFNPNKIYSNSCSAFTLPNHLDERSTTFNNNNNDSSSMMDDDCAMMELWSMTTEQQLYYTKQFCTLQENPRGFVQGNVAKVFFEKSGLQVKDLSHIWKLSDLDEDGALSLPEFCIAMHLVVLRRNRVELPDQLPEPLKNSYNKILDQQAQSNATSNSSTASTTAISQISVAQFSDSNYHHHASSFTVINNNHNQTHSSLSLLNQNKIEKSPPSSASSSFSSCSSSSSSSSVKHNQPKSSSNDEIIMNHHQQDEECNRLSQNWIRFNDSPSFSSSSLPGTNTTLTTATTNNKPDCSSSSSPTKLANFDYNIVDYIATNPNIRHPVPLRVSPTKPNTNCANSPSSSSTAALSIGIEHLVLDETCTSPQQQKTTFTHKQIIDYIRAAENRLAIIKQHKQSTFNQNTQPPAAQVQHAENTGQQQQHYYHQNVGQIIQTLNEQNQLMMLDLSNMIKIIQQLINDNNNNHHNHKNNCNS